MSSSRMRPSLLPLRRLGIAAFVAAVVAAPLYAGAAYALDDALENGGLHAQSAPQPQEDEDADPEANLPYLFAVYIITWAGFFAFVFVMSRRQRELKREIETLRMALVDKRIDEATRDQEWPNP